MKVVVTLGMIVLLFSSCQKIMEFYSVNSSVEGSPTTRCRIRSFSSNLYESVNRTVVHYNENNDPWRIKYYAEWLPDGVATEYIKYDSLGRLIQHEPDLTMGNHRTYVYEGTSRVPVRDTATDFQGKKYLETFKVDAIGRIVEEEIKWIYSPPDLEDDFEFKTERHRFFYDLQGNRQVNPYDKPWHKPLRYSKKPSLYSLHPVWQIINRDFSKNGIDNVSTFNENGLPTSFRIDDFAYWPPFLDMSQYSRVAYDCIDVVK